MSGPNFIIGGAPKCGTTALANYLREHEAVYFSDVKEPFYWADDMPSMRESTGFDTEERYLRLFSRADSRHKAIGEGSTLYLYSTSAIDNILSWRPDTKFVFMLRRPSEIAHAYHMQMVFHEFEDVRDFQQAWEETISRKVGRIGSSICEEPKLLQYGNIASVGSQLKLAMEKIESSRLKVVLFDDFVADTKAVYVEVCDFLGVPYDNRTDFPRENPAMASRNPILTRWMRSGAVRAITLSLKRRLAGQLYAVARQAKHSVMFQSKPREVLDVEFDRHLHNFFLPEVEIVEQLIGRKLGQWKQPKS